MFWIVQAKNNDMGIYPTDTFSSFAFFRDKDNAYGFMLDCDEYIDDDGLVSGPYVYQVVVGNFED